MKGYPAQQAPCVCDVIIPVLNEESAIRQVLEDIPGHLVRTILVCDNGSSDGTARVAASCGATVIRIPQRGYGSACLGGIRHLETLPSAAQPDIVVFLDGDYSDYPEQLEEILEPLRSDQADLVIGSRALGRRESGSMTTVQRFGNTLATWLIRVLYGYNFTDLGPFRAIRWNCLQGLNMKDRNFGWTVEMQVKAAKQQLRCTEVPVNYRHRIGTSKVSGTIKGSILAGYKILFTIFRNL